jgi:hypothetical protein
MSYLKAVLLGAVMMATPAIAQVPQISRAEAAQLYAAGGFPIRNNAPSNGCGEPAKPTITFVDMNADKRPEALFVDRGLCYLPDRAWASIVAKGADGKWRQIFGQNGTVRAIATRSAGWLDLQWTSNGKMQPLRYDGTAYVGSAVRPTAKPVPGAPPMPSPAPTPPSVASGTKPTGDAAIFRAAGLVKRSQQWRSDCDDPGTASYGPGTIETRKDLNGDGRPEAVVIEQSVYCYGNTGTGFWLVSQQADGSWKLITSGVGVADFLRTKGVGGWPDIQIGGPGFCFPVERWNGTKYILNRREYEGRPCR